MPGYHPAYYVFLFYVPSFTPAGPADCRNKKADKFNFKVIADIKKRLSPLKITVKIRRNRHFNPGHGPSRDLQAAIR
jgi:hypothetical protein